MKTSGRYSPYTLMIHCFTVIVTLSLSANAFTQTETHPFILYTPNSVFSIRENITIEQPYASWFQQELVEAELILQHTNWWADDSVPQETRAYYAKVLLLSMPLPILQTLPQITAPPGQENPLQDYITFLPGIINQTSRVIFTYPKRHYSGRKPMIF